jgi:regulator of replication initiation timing
MRKKKLKELVDKNKRLILEDPNLLEEIYTKIDNKRASSTNIKSQKVDK